MKDASGIPLAEIQSLLAEMDSRLDSMARLRDRLTESVSEKELEIPWLLSCIDNRISSLTMRRLAYVRTIAAHERDEENTKIRRRVHVDELYVDGEIV